MSIISDIIYSLPSIKQLHQRDSYIYKVLDTTAKEAIERMFSHQDLHVIQSLQFPNISMGAISSKDLFGLDELILFSFYLANRNTYKNVIDIGANLGLHSLLLAKIGFQVTAYEPDPYHFQILQENMALNHVKTVTAYQAAVSNQSGKAQFVRVLGNTTSSHLMGSKTPYGELETFEVPVIDIKEIIKKADLIKMDVEGHEGTILLATSSQDWDHTDALLEIGSIERAKEIYEHLQKMGVNIFTQKSGWQRVKNFEGMPISYKEGSLFISKKSDMPWT
ncbi:MAG: FkbM family methyltransferase [Simkaniaceae bacterium]|nr:FkbM family methyltransferase [Simkaniaceae bacterium]